jgi:signal peptidase I
LPESTEPNLPPDQPAPPRYVLRPPERSRRGKGFLAMCGTVIWPGIGHVIVGESKRGLGWFLISFTIAAAVWLALWFPFLVAALILLIPLEVITCLLCLFDAYRYGRKSQKHLMGSAIARYGAGLLLLLVAWFAGPKKVNEKLQDHIVTLIQLNSISMEPMIQPKDLVLCNKRVFPQRGDIALVLEPEHGRRFVERVVGFPGDIVEIVQTVLHVNGQPVASPSGVTYTSYDVLNHRMTGPGCEGHPIKLGPDEYFCLGDKSTNANDARYWPALPGHQRGAITADRIIGKIGCICWPPNRWRMF